MNTASFRRMESKGKIGKKIFLYGTKNVNKRENIKT